METALLSSRLDEDDFDWEAAVREIDSACAATIASTSINAAVSPNLPSTVSGGSCPRPAAPLCRGRQSTLDTFVGTNAKQKNNNICSNESGHQELEGRSVRNNPFRHGDGTPAVRIDLEAANTWIYPVNVPLRDYQFTIAKKALFSNTLVALPTGLGKTLIAAVVMYNYFRWFPEGKIVFAAPSRPLVMQQIEACHNIVGIPQEWTIDMTGQMSPPKRSSFWKAKRVFFLTPQVFEKDIQSGICLVRQLVCLVFDEAHRAMGNYAYCVAVRELNALSMNLRILALTATPGSKHQTIQQVIDNLCISTLEYRNESDHDVNSYMHSRKLDVIVVPMGKDAVEINSILLQAVQPFIARLSDIGALPHRDFSTLSPSELLNLRDKFRQAPPPTLPQSKYRDVEAYFCVLITFYHIRKLLSSHGIKPAYEMLEDKFNRGPFSNFLSKTEAFWEAKNLMQKSLAHGAPTPKVVKMLEILVDHFTKKDPNNSRVIIFSNFRGSVRDIMSNLSSLGNMVKAAEFIGQSSGKTIKGQTQKVQQAVLEKFRSGAYNVIVATSIGEEGLDIMEVDLVICFDANVSPLRMIQRMGRTGRKNDGRVVVLACEGTEQKAYLKKLASSKAIRKHMHNGGIKSFNFHPSPRMVPHICQPQVQYLEMSIEQFVHRGKKVKCATMNGSPFLSNISNDEQHLLAKYFPQTEDETCKLSLIAFPSFQALPSQISRVRHSFRTTLMFIDAMQALQGLSFSKVNNEVIEVETSSRPSNELSACLDDIGLDSALVRTSSQIGGAPFQVLPRQSLVDKTGFCMHHHDIPKMKPHRFLFSNNSVTLSSSGIVFIAYVPVIQHRGFKDCKVTSAVHGNLFPEVLKPNATCTEISPNFSGKPVKQVQNVKLKDFSWLIQEVEVEQENKKHSFQAPGFEPNHQDSNISTAKISCIMEDASAEINVERSINAATNILLSPRLTHFIAEGVVPESPILNIKPLSRSDENRLFSACSWEEANLVSQSVVVLDTPNEHKSFGHCSTPPNLMRISDIPSKETNYEKILATVNCSTIESIYEKNIMYSAKEVFRTPNTMKQSLSEDWKCSSGEASNSLINAPKYKRLCKQRDLDRNLPVKTLEKRFNLVEATCGSIKNTHRNKIKYKNGETKKSIKQGDAFIEEEAEVSDDASVSEDEMDDEMHDRYEDSFIDDRIHPTEGSTEAENCGVDMTAFYRRSLLTQSPTIFQANYQSISSQSLSSGTAVSSPERHPTLIITPQHSMQSLNQLDCQNSVISNSIPGKASQPGRCSDKLEGRKRKLFSQPSDTMPEENSQLQPETQPACAETALEHHQNAAKSDTFILCDNDDDDDDFYQGLDLDEVEAQATKLIRSRSQAQAAPIDDGTSTGINFSCSLFDLGI